MRVLQQLMPKEGEEGTLNEQLEKIQQLSEEDFERLMVFARDVVTAALVMPRLVARPSPGIETEIGPDDIPFTDFWFIFNWAMSGATGIPVKTKEGETTVEAVHTFPESAGSGASTGDHSGDVPSASVNDDGNPGSGDRPSV